MPREIRLEDVDEVLLQVSEGRPLQAISQATGVPEDAILAIVHGKYFFSKGKLTILRVPGSRRRKQTRSSKVNDRR